MGTDRLLRRDLEGQEAESLAEAQKGAGMEQKVAENVTRGRGPLNLRSGR